MIMSFLPRILFPPSSLFVTAMSILSVVSLTNGGYAESKGKHIKYSKFFNLTTSKLQNDQQIVKMASRNGMFLLYAPAFFVGLVSFVVFYDRDQDLRFLMVISALTIHFLKRVIEVLLVHKYSGYIAFEAVIPISLSYAISTATMIYAQYLSQASLEPLIDLKHIGVALFLVGITGNFYHHLILSTLRKNDDKQYKIPKGGLFDLVTCPHYLFEIIGFIGVSCISQTMYSVCFLMGTISYLTGRSFATREWYVSKFGEKFNKDVKALVPYVL
ncbi:hypothetical protein R6Q59_014880 [Mikania micrantha]